MESKGIDDALAAASPHDGLPRTGYRSALVHARHVDGERANPEDFERRSCGRFLWSLFKRRIRLMGAALPGGCDSTGLSRASVIPLHWLGVVDARCVGSASLFVGQPHLAVYAELFFRMFDFRHAHRNVVLGRSALNPSAPASLATQQAKTPTLQRRKKGRPPGDGLPFAAFGLTTPLFPFRHDHRRERRSSLSRHSWQQTRARTLEHHRRLGIKRHQHA